jgi:integrase
MPLSAVAIRRAVTAGTPCRLTDALGLYLLVRPCGRAWWRFDYRIHGTRKTLSMGTYPEVTLEEARARRLDARRLVARGIDPSGYRKAQRVSDDAGVTFDAVAAEWLALQAKTWAPATAAKAGYHLGLLSPYLGQTHVGEVDAPMLLQAVRVWDSRHKHDTAHALRQRAGQVIRYAIATGRAVRDPSADLRGALTPLVHRHRAAVTDPKGIGALLRAIDGYGGHITVVRALQLLALLFVRPGELRLALWDEFDVDHAVWRVPAERMKSRRPHVVPLATQAVTLLRDLARHTGRTPRLFPSLRSSAYSISENTLNGALRRLGYADDEMTAHGFRAAATTRLNELGWRPDVVEAQMAHRERSAVRAAYHRAEYLEERRTMMQAWADHLDELRALPPS